MTDMLFHEVPDAQVVLRTKGVYRQAKVYRRGQCIYAAQGSGFIRLLSHSGTSAPNTSWQVGEHAAAPRELDLGLARNSTPKWDARV
jgi:hypothetical protein